MSHSLAPIARLFPLIALTVPTLTVLVACRMPPADALRDGGDDLRDGGEELDDAGPKDTEEGDTIENPWGFSMRVPGSRVLSCPEEEEGSFCDDDLHARDADHVCTLSIDGHDAVVYVRATATRAYTGPGFPFPIYEDVRAFIAEGGEVREVPGEYDYGGGHHNDFLRITLDGVRYTWNHSSYGYGFRACHPPDCLRREAGDSFTDGCQPERTLPEVCVLVEDPLPELVDTFARCPGDDG